MPIKIPKRINENDKEYFCEVVTYLKSANRPKYEETNQHFMQKYPNNKPLLKQTMQRMEIWVNENQEDPVVKKWGIKSDQKRITKTDDNRITKIKTIVDNPTVDSNLIEEEHEIGLQSDYKNGLQSDYKNGLQSDHENGSQLDPEIENENVGPEDPSPKSPIIISQKNSDLQIHDALTLLKQYQKRLSRVSCGTANAIGQEIKETILDKLEDPIK